MRKRLKYIALILALVVVIVLLVVYCNSDYTIYWFGKWYLHMDKSSYEGFGVDYIEDIQFNSLLEMRHKILTGDFTEREMRTIRGWVIWAGNNGRIPLFDLFNLYEPVYPSSFSINKYKVYLKINDYSFTAKENNGTRISMHFRSQEKYNKGVDLLCNFKEYLLSSSRREILAINHCEDRNATEYISYYDWPKEVDKDIIYQIENNNTSYYVWEHYDCENSNTIPSNIRIYVPMDGQFLEINSYNLSERPSVEWLSQFGIKKFEG